METNIKVGAVKALVEARTVVWGKVAQVLEANTPNACLVVTGAKHEALKGVTCRISNEEADANFKSGASASLLVRTVPFIVTGYDEETDTATCSRRQAQDILKDELRPQLEAGTVLKGRIISFNRTGAYVDVGGVVGLLRTRDYSSDHSQINETKAVGDELSVVCLSISETNLIRWKMPVLVTRTTPVVYDFTANSIVAGTVTGSTTVTNGTGESTEIVFVRLDDSVVDASCFMPRDGVAVRDRVSVLISSIAPPKTEFATPFVRGRIMGSLVQ